MDSETRPGYYVDIQFLYTTDELDKDDNLVEAEITLKLHIGHILEKAYQTYKMICQFNINNNPGIIYIRLRFRPDGDPTTREIVLSRKTPQGIGDW